MFLMVFADVADVVRKALGVDTGVLPGVAFTDTGITFAWLMQGSSPNQLTYTVRKRLLRLLPDFCWTWMHAVARAGGSMHDL